MISSNFTVASLFLLLSSFSPLSPFSSSLSSFPSISQWKLEIERIDNAAKTYPRNFLLRINLVVLRGRSKVQVPFAISAAYSHPVYLVFARSSVQTENRKKVYAYTDCLSLSLSLLNPADPNDFHHHPRSMPFLRGNKFPARVRPSENSR